jgi:phosphatidylserine synthase
MNYLTICTIFFCAGAKVPEYEKFQWLPVDHLCIIVYLVCCLLYKTLSYQAVVNMPWVYHLYLCIISICSSGFGINLTIVNRIDGLETH